MKYCENCKKTYPDNQVFCSDCGNKLTDYVAIPTAANTPNTTAAAQPNPTVVVTDSNAGQQNTTTNSNVGMNPWLPVIAAGAGAVVGWFWSGLFGFILGVIGVALVTKMKKEGNVEDKHVALTWILGIVDFVFWIIAMSL